MDADVKMEGVGEVDGLHHGFRHTVPDVEERDRMVKAQIPGTQTTQEEEPHVSSEQKGQDWPLRCGSIHRC